MKHGKCNILLANKITYTNIPRNSEFTKESIDSVMDVKKRDYLRGKPKEPNFFDDICDLPFNVKQRIDEDDEYLISSNPFGKDIKYYVKSKTIKRI